MDPKLEAKHFNEQMKLLATTMNSLAIALLIAGVVFPIARLGQAFDPFGPEQFSWVLGALALHFVAHFCVIHMKSEE